MAFNGILAGDQVVLVSAGGKPVVDTDRPDPMDGFDLVGSWADTGGTISREWRYVPIEGTAQEAAVELARMRAEALTDEQALRVPALYGQWSGDSVAYKAGSRLLYKGVLYKVLQDHTSQAGWTPDAASSLYARVLPGQSGEVGEWVQPDSTNGYAKGDRVTHSGKTWVSNVDNNVWEPGAEGVTQWDEVTDAQ